MNSRSRCGFVAQWLDRVTIEFATTQDPGFDSRRGCAVFFRLIRLSVLLLVSSSSIFVGAEREELIRNDPDKSEFTIEWI